MKELAVLSGKGGTGKTTVTAALAAHWSHRALFVDADVDAANLHLVLRPMVKESHTFFGGLVPRIESERCSGCGTCTELCRFHAIEDGRVTRIACEGCGLCALACPQGAIEMVERPGGNWFVGQTRHGWLLHARLRPGEGNSGKLVALLKEESKKLAAREGLDRIVCDGPPGASCPAIATLAGSRAVLAVAEPSTSGLHDLTRTLDLARHFAVPAFATVNRADLAPDLTAAIADECLERSVPLLGEIPFDPAVIACVEEGVPAPSRPDAPAARALAQLARSLDQLLEEIRGDGGE